VPGIVRRWFYSQAAEHYREAVLLLMQAIFWLPHQTKSTTQHHRITCLHRNHSSFWLVHPLSKQAKGANQKKLHRKLAVLKNSRIFASPFEKGAVFSEFYFEIPPFATTLIGAARRE
jgi:hypothetical protein